MCALVLGAAAAAGGLVWWNHYQLGAARRAVHLERWDEARRHLGRIWPQNEEAELLAARLERLAGNYKDAEERLYACKQSRGDTDAAIQLEWLLLRAEWGDLDHVAAGLWSAVNQGDPQSPAILEALCRGYVRETRYDDAQRCVNRWVEIDPQSATAHYWLGRIHTVQGYLDGAEREFVRALELEPDFSDARLKLAMLFINMRNAPAAWHHLQILEKSEPDSPPVLLQLAEYYRLMGKTDEARRTTDALFRVDPGDAAGLSLRGALELQDHKPRDAETWLRRAIKADPTNLEARNNLYLCLKSDPRRKKEAAEALANFQRVRADMERVMQLLHTRAMTAAGADADVPAEIGEIYLRNGNERLGMLWVGLALRRDPSHRGAHRALADFYERTGWTAKAAAERAQAQ